METTGFLAERDFAGRQYQGQRNKQEDYYAFSKDGPADHTPIQQLILGLGDGLGAHMGGNLASYYIVHEFINACRSSTLGDSWRLRVALDTANEKLFRISQRYTWEKLPMGSTIIGLVIDRHYCRWVSVGDSPLFLFRKGNLFRLNADHSLVPILEERVRRGELTAEEAKEHPDRHILQAACMGQPLTLVDSRTDPFALESGDIVIAASDGIFTLELNQIQELLTFGRTTTAGKIADALMFAIRCADNPRQDNATIAVIKIP